MRCGSVWECAPCSFKISARRAAEVLTAINGCQAAGGSVMLATFTFPHTRNDSAADLVSKLSNAWKLLGQRKSLRSALESFGVHGTIRSLEITWGQANGWHPHLHVLLFVDGAADADGIRARLLPLWQAACVGAGLPLPSDLHGLDVRGGDRAAGYVAKWGLHTEITLASMKKGKGDRYTPWELLAQLDFTGNSRWRFLWHQYLEAVNRSKQLQWSKGLKRKYQVGEETDDQLATHGGDEDEVLWRQIPAKTWSLVYQRKLIGQVLALAAAGDRLALDSLLSGVINSSP